MLEVLIFGVKVGGVMKYYFFERSGRYLVELVWLCVLFGLFNLINGVVGFF